MIEPILDTHAEITQQLLHSIKLLFPIQTSQISESGTNTTVHTVQRWMAFPVHQNSPNINPHIHSWGPI